MKRFLIIVLFLLSLLSYSHASRGQYIASMVTGSILGFGIGNFIVGDIRSGFGYLGSDLLLGGMIALWAAKAPIIKNAREARIRGGGDPLKQNEEDNLVDIILTIVGVFGLVGLLVTRIMQVVATHKFYANEIGFVSRKLDLKYQYAQSRNVFENFDVGLTAVSFQKTL